MDKDFVDRLIAQWRRERPEIDPSGLAVAARVLRLARLFERRVETALEPFGLQLWSFDVLATLRRHGPPYSMPPKDLLKAVMLTSGAMTNRLDRLENAGLLVRSDDPDDRRGILVTLTDAGLALIDKAITARFEEARDAIASLDKRDVDGLVHGLRALSLALDEPVAAQEHVALIPKNRKRR